MNRAGPIAVGAVLVILAASILIARWLGAGFSPLLIVVGLIVVVGVPSALWLALGRVPGAGSRRMPRAFWVGLAMIVGGFASFSAGLVTHGSQTTSYAITSAPSGAPARTLRFAALPTAGPTDLRIVFPHLVVGRVLHSSDGTYEVWLKTPGARGYSLQVTWAQGQVQVENQGINTTYSPRTVVHLSQSQVRSLAKLPKGVYGPVAFPGYVLYVSLSLDQYWAIASDGTSGTVTGGTW